MTPGEQIRNYLNLMETANWDPSLLQYIKQHPDEVSATQKAALDRLMDQAREQSYTFDWAIGRLPDGRFITGFPRTLSKWRLPIVDQGDSDQLMEMIKQRIHNTLV
jgi:hypothetical protein